MAENNRMNEEMREEYNIQERQISVMTTELTETKNSLESNERAREYNSVVF